MAPSSYYYYNYYTVLGKHGLSNEIRAVSLRTLAGGWVTAAEPGDFCETSFEITTINRRRRVIRPGLLLCSTLSHGRRFSFPSTKLFKYRPPRARPGTNTICCVKRSRRACVPPPPTPRSCANDLRPTTCELHARPPPQVTTNSVIIIIIEIVETAASDIITLASLSIISNVGVYETEFEPIAGNIAYTV